MDLSGRTGRRIVLFALLGLIIPMVIFPRTLGMHLAKAALINVFYELVFYAVVAFLFQRRSSLIQLAQAAGVCLVFRLVLGAVFGIVISLMYSMQFSVSITMGLSAYLPTVLFQMLITPFALKPILDQMIKPAQVRTRVPAPTREQGVPGNAADSETSAEVPEMSASNRESDSAMTTPGTSMRAMEGERDNAAMPLTGINGFERAVRYIGEHGSVFVAAVVDPEGLLLANFHRGDFEPEDWAPLALLLLEQNRQVVSRAGMNGPDRIDLVMSEKRVVIVRHEQYSLLVIADRQSDDVLHIRINQGMDTIVKYVNERYASLQITNMERIHVSGTE